MAMQYNFIHCPFDDPKKIEAAEVAMENASDEGWQVHSWHPLPLGGFMVLMIRVPEPDAEALDRTPGIAMQGRSARLGRTTTPQPPGDPQGGPEIKKPILAPSGKSG